MVDIAGLERLRQQRYFAKWDEFVSPERVAASEATARRLIDELIAHGPVLREDMARAAVDACVRNFNALDDGWICTIEREDICERIGMIIDLCGFEYGEEWFREREW